MATPNLILYTYFFIFLPFTSSESGSGSETPIGYGTCADDEQENSFKCFVQMLSLLNNFLICEATGTELNLNEANANFFWYGTQPCFTKNPLVANCSIDSSDLIGILNICLTITLTNPCKNCQKLRAVHIVKPEAPYGLNITYQEQANEYLVQFSTPHVANSFLKDKLIHQLAYRQENTNWTTTESDFVRLKLLGKLFEPNVMYEMKVRSRPNGQYFRGYWSDWSSSQNFNTSARTSSGIKLKFHSLDKVVLITASIASFFVLFVVILLVPIFWKNRIKAIVWPTIPNHKTTLDKLCNKLRKVSTFTSGNSSPAGLQRERNTGSPQLANTTESQMSVAKRDIFIKTSNASFFNAESLGYADIHKVESIQAKSEVAHLQPPSYNLEAETEDSLEPKSNLNHIHHGWLKLPLAYEGMLSTEEKDTLYSGSEDISGDLYNEGRMADQHGWNSHDLCKYSIVPMDHIFPPELKEGSCDHTYSNGKTRVLNKEETYITMASFFENKGKL